MLEDFLAIVDRLISLKEYKNRRLNKLFEDLFEPVFNELLIVHRDYLNMFEETYKILPSAEFLESSQPISKEYRQQMNKAANYLRKTRIEFEPVRVKLRALAKNMDTMELADEAHAFVQSVCNYFPSGEIPTRRSSSTELLDTIQYYSDKAHVDIPEDFWSSQYSYEIQEYIQEVINNHKDNWSNVCETYVQLKIAAANRP